MEERWGLYGKAWDWYTRARQSDSVPQFLLAWLITSAFTLAAALAVIWVVTLAYL